MRNLTKGKRQVATVLVIDTAAVLRAQSKYHDYAQAIANAERDGEWLVLPFDTPERIPGELTALLDDGCIERVEFLRGAA